LRLPYFEDVEKPRTYILISKNLIVQNVITY